MPRFMLLLHHTPGAAFGMSPEEIQQTVQKYRDWFEQVQTSGRYVTSDKLLEEGGRIVTKENGQVTVVDGPYSESKEVIGGYFTLRAESYAEAEALVRECPFLEHGTVVIRQTD